MYYWFVCLFVYRIISYADEGVLMTFHILSLFQNQFFLHKISFSENVLFRKCPFQKMSISENVHFRKCPFRKLSFSEIVLTPTRFKTKQFVKHVRVYKTCACTQYFSYYWGNLVTVWLRNSEDTSRHHLYKGVIAHPVSKPLLYQKGAVQSRTGKYQIYALRCEE